MRDYAQPKQQSLPYMQREPRQPKPLAHHRRLRRPAKEKKSAGDGQSRQQQKISPVIELLIEVVSRLRLGRRIRARPPNGMYRAERYRQPDKCPDDRADQ